MSIRWNLRIALGVVAFVATCLASTNQNPAKGGEQVWKEYVYPADGFAVTAPKPPREQDVEYYRTFEFGLDSGLYLRLEVSKGKRNCAEFERWATQHGSSKQHKLVMAAGRTVLETWMQRPNIPRLFLIRATCINSTTYVFDGNWPTDAPASDIDAPRPEIVTRIFDSFRVVEKESARRVGVDNGTLR